MKLQLILLCAATVAACAQTVPIPPAIFTGVVKHIDSGALTLTIPDQDDVEISCTHKTHYYSGSQKIKRTDIKPGDRVTVETALDLYLKPEAVNVRLLPQTKQ
jgi:translation initiation factor IF-1